MQYCLEQKIPVTKVILFWAPFSSGYDIQNSSEKFRAAILKYVFGIKPEKKFDEETRRVFDVLSNLQYKEYPAKDFNPLQGKTTLEFNKVRVELHVKLAEKTNMMKYLRRIARLSKREGIRIFVVIPPFSDRYLGFFPADIFAKISWFCRKHDLRLITFRSDDFSGNHFFDDDHLNIEGANIMTQAIYREICSD